MIALPGIEACGQGREDRGQWACNATFDEHGDDEDDGGDDHVSRLDILCGLGGIRKDGRESREGGAGMAYEGEGEQEREEGYMRKGAWWSEETREKEEGRHGDRQREGEREQHLKENERERVRN